MLFKLPVEQGDDSPAAYHLIRLEHVAAVTRGRPDPASPNAVPLTVYLAAGPAFRGLTTAWAADELERLLRSASAGPAAPPPHQQPAPQPLPSPAFPSHAAPAPASVAGRQPAPDLDPDDWLTQKQAREELGNISRETLKKVIKEGRLTEYRPAENTVRYKRRDVLACLDAVRTTAGQA